MSLRRLTVIVIGCSLTAGACRARDEGPSSATAGSRGSTEAGGKSGSALAWFPGVAPMLLLPANSPERALVALADSSLDDHPEGPLDAPGYFLRLDGVRVGARVSIALGSEGCIEGVLDPVPAQPWGVGFVGGSPVALVVDSLPALSRKDSSELTIMVFRLASAIPNDPGGRFSGLPFALVDLWRVRLPDGSVLVAAATKRQINQEDSPLEERTFLVAESDSAASGGFSLVHSGRSSGPEETVESRELLAAVTFPPAPSIFLAVGHDFGFQTAYSVVERVARGRWAVRWESRRFSC